MIKLCVVPRRKFPPVSDVINFSIKKFSSSVEERGRMDRQNVELRNVEKMLPECLKEADGKNMSQINLLKTTTAYIWALSLACQFGISSESRAFQLSLQMIKDARNSRWQLQLIDETCYDYLFEKEESSFFRKLKTRMFSLRHVILQSAVKHASQLLDLFHKEANCSSSTTATMVDSINTRHNTPVSSFNHLQSFCSPEHNFSLDALADSSSRLSSNEKYLQGPTWPYCHLSPLPPNVHSSPPVWANQDQNWPPQTPLTLEDISSSAHPYTRGAPYQSSPYMTTPESLRKDTPMGLSSLIPARGNSILRSSASYKNSQTVTSGLQDISNCVSFEKPSDLKSRIHLNYKQTPDISPYFVELFNSATSRAVSETGEDATSQRKSCRFAPSPSPAYPNFSPLANTSSLPNPASASSCTVDMNQTTTFLPASSPQSTRTIQQNHFTTSSRKSYPNIWEPITQNGNEQKFRSANQIVSGLTSPPYSNQALTPHLYVPNSGIAPSMTPNVSITNTNISHSSKSHCPPPFSENTSCSRKINNSIQEDSGFGSDLDTSNVTQNMALLYPQY